MCRQLFLLTVWLYGWKCQPIRFLLCELFELHLSSALISLFLKKPNLDAKDDAVVIICFCCKDKGSIVTVISNLTY